jgi:hypothetical protein
MLNAPIIVTGVDDKNIGINWAVQPRDMIRSGSEDKVQGTG